MAISIRYVLDKSPSSTTIVATVVPLPKVMVRLALSSYALLLTVAVAFSPLKPRVSKVLARLWSAWTLYTVTPF